MKTALVHDWLITLGGAEKVLAELWKLFPSKIHTLLYDTKRCQSLPFGKKDVVPSCLQIVPFALQAYRFFPMFFPYAIEKIDLSYAQCILSSSHAVAKGIKHREDQLHISYCYTPMRYAWDLRETYLAPYRNWQRKLYSYFLDRLQNWDRNSAPRVDLFLTISHYVAQRIQTHYGRKAQVIYPPVCVEKGRLALHKESFYVTHSRLVPYKNIDLLIGAFRLLPDRQLLIVGEGPHKAALQKQAPSNVIFAGFVEEKELWSILSQARAYLFAAEEDFGMGVVEAQACGIPVIALGKGGAVETVKEGMSGLFFLQNTCQSVVEAIKRFEKKEDTFDPAQIKQSVAHFNQERFCSEFSSCVLQAQKEFYEDRHSCRRKWH